MVKPIFYITFLACVAASSHTYGQELPLTKRTITRAIRENKWNTDAGMHDWITCDQDSSYYKSDTLLVFSDPYSYFEMHCCKIKGWNFLSSHSIQLFNEDLCGEPPITSINPSDKFTLVYKKKGKRLYMKIFNSESTTNFEVIGFKKKISSHFADKRICYDLTLKRVR